MGTKPTAQEIAKQITTTLLGSYEGFALDSADPSQEPGAVVLEGTLDNGDYLSFQLEVTGIDVEPAVIG